MKRRFMAVALLAALVNGASAAVAVAKTNTKHPTVGPKGLKFYFPPKLPKGPRGTLIWERPMTGDESPFSDSPPVIGRCQVRPLPGLRACASLDDQEVGARPNGPASEEVSLCQGSRWT